MSSASIRVLMFKEAQIEGEKQRVQRVMAGLERQLTQGNRIMGEAQKRFAEVKAAALEKSAKTTPDRLMRVGLENLIQEAQKIKIRQRRTESSVGVITKRKEMQGEDLARLKRRREIVQREITRLKSRREHCEDAADCEYRAALGARDENHKFAELNQLSPAILESEAARAYLFQEEHIFQAGAEMKEHRTREVLTPQQSTLLKVGKRDCLDLEYRAMDGSTFNLELDSQGRDLRVFILSEHESDRRLLHKDKNRLKEELLRRGFQVRAFAIHGLAALSERGGTE